MPSHLVSGRYKNFEVSIQDAHILIVTLDRQKQLNCIDKATSLEITRIWDLFDNDEDLWVGIISGRGRAFCTGADLKEWHEMNQAGVTNSMDAPGLAGLPRRTGKKPIIAAVNGITMGGGFEMVANCDMVVAASTAVFALPEARRGIVPVAGCLPRLTRTIGLQRTTDLALTGRSVSAQTLHEWGLINHVVPTAEEAVELAIEIARSMCQNSPDALWVGRKGIRLSWESGSVEEAVSDLAQEWYPRLMKGENFAEGIRAYVEKREPNWVRPKL
ncbi:Delta(3,5)-Delta(2,4)-dienoyl-CoA isomerase, mitochondrial [Sphaceloma murrayae]|uniref:Delta(3,5)-Delta(2,4)-dienoyl-CoA isomerase, mitochondrial n=1 Tax=Sphaceloma murrayae TaxID=2082308 RepID=A0A2K1QFN0_9PEZI|nr:Delta(3,5)-Delta(2,4)-dienoyl-CoA isomerase, mitochondrial [Sphaceloma murrayae]